MSAKPRLRTKSDTVINFTNRVDIKPNHILFEVAQRDERKLAYRVTLRNWPNLAGRVSPRHNLTLLFERGGEPSQRVNFDGSESLVLGCGVIAGEIDGGFDPASLGLKVQISDPRSHMIVISGTKGRPDVEDADIDGQPERRIGNVVPLRPVAGKDDGTINIYESADVSGSWNLKLRNVECPHLVVSPKVGKAAMSTDPLTQNLVFPEVVRRIVRELAVHPDEYASEPWVRFWRNFAAELSGVGDWAYFTGDEDGLDVAELDARVDNAVRRYQEKYLPEFQTTTFADFNSED